MAIKYRTNQAKSKNVIPVDDSAPQISQLRTPQKVFSKDLKPFECSHLNYKQGAQTSDKQATVKMLRYQSLQDRSANKQEHISQFNLNP